MRKPHGRSPPAPGLFVKYTGQGLLPVVGKQNRTPDGAILTSVLIREASAHVLAAQDDAVADTTAQQPVSLSSLHAESDHIQCRLALRSADFWSVLEE